MNESAQCLNQDKVKRNVNIRYEMSWKRTLMNSHPLLSQSQYVSVDEALRAFMYLILHYNKLIYLYRVR